MTGIERLRELIGAVDSSNTLWSITSREYDQAQGLTSRSSPMLRDVLAFIADQIERELDATVADSPYDALPPDEREAIAWVREHGGVECLRRMFQDADNRRVELCGALGIDLDKGWSEAMAAMRLRLMPEGMEWPRFEGGEMVLVGSDFADGLGETHTVTSIEFLEDGTLLHWNPDEPEECVWIRTGEHVKRPAPKVLDADGVEICVGDTVWHVETGEQCKVVEADSRSVSVDFRVDGDGAKHTGSILPANLTHRAPVLAADGKPLREGDEVWDVHTHKHYVVSEAKDGKALCRAFGTEPSVDFSEFAYHFFAASNLTHERPETDSWERLEEDAAKNPFDYCKDVGHRLDTCENSEAYKARDIVRRAKALAGDA